MSIWRLQCKSDALCVVRLTSGIHGVEMKLAAMLLVVFVGAPLVVLAYSETGVPGRAGGFGGPTCLVCHTGSPLNAPDGELSLSGLPERFTPGEVYKIRVQLKRAELARGGFSLASRFASGTLVRQQAGVWQSPEERVAFYPDAQTKVQYPQHSAAGADAEVPGVITWELEWKAPDETEPVQFNVAATMSNNDRSPLGDVVYTREVTVPANLR